MMNDPKLNMKSFKPARPLVRFVGAALTAFAVGSPPAFAQEAESSEQEVFELSPFVVDAASEIGYRATQTLAGTRIASNLKDIPAQVDVMTAEFLDDVGAVTIEEAMLYSLNAENTQEYANNVSGNQTDGVIGLTSGSRVRGLGNASRTRDYFATYFQTDRYNSVGVTFNSGPNAILFGLGSPAGIMNQDSQQAYFNDRTVLEFRVDSENSYRGNFLVNREIIDGKLAVAVAGLYEDEELWQKPSFDRKKRAYGAFVYKPFKKTTIRASYEAITRNANRPRNTALRDGVTPYLEWREAKMQELGITDPLDPRLYWAPGDPWDDSTPFLIESGVNLLITGSYEPIPEEFLLGSFVGKFGRILDTNSVLPGTFRTTDAVKARRPRDLPGVHPADKIPRSLDDSIFPYDVNVGGSTRVDQSGDIILASLEQEITDNFFIQLAYHRETFDRFYVDLIRGDAQELMIDVNRYLPQERDSTEEPVLNPNRGRYYVQNWGKGEDRKNDMEDYRATATYRLDFTDRDGWMKWLGSHNITALVDYSKREEGNQGGRTTLYYDENGQWPAGVPIYSRGTASTHFRLTHRVYLDDPNDPNGSHFTHHPDKDATVLNSEPFAGYDSVHITTYPDPELGLSYYDGGKWQTNEVKGQAMAVQSAFWNNRIIATYGRRKDDFKTQEVSTTRAVDAPAPYDDRQIYYGLISPSLDDPDIDDSATNDQFGVVFHALPWLSVFYNESSNSSIGNPGLNVVDGLLLPPSSGEGTDYGIILDLFEGKFTMRVNRFENSQLRVRSQQFDGLKWSVKSIETKLMNWELNEGVDPPAGVSWDPPTTWDPYYSNEDTQRANVLSDLESTGTEITLTYNPTRNWRIRLSAARTESVETNIGANWQEYVAERQPYWEHFYDRAWDGGNVAEPGEPTFGEEVESSVYAEYIDLIAVADGRASDRLSKYRVNLTTSYNFKEGRLKGWTIGGSYRFRSKRSIGYPLIEVNGQDVFDIENPWFGKGEKNIDAFITYNTKLKFLGKNVRARFQLNIRNVFDDRELLPQRAYTNGEVSQYRVQAPRTFILSTRFEY